MINIICRINIICKTSFKIFIVTEQWNVYLSTKNILDVYKYLQCKKTCQYLTHFKIIWDPFTLIYKNIVSYRNRFLSLFKVKLSLIKPRVYSFTDNVSFLYTIIKWAFLDWESYFKVWLFIFGVFVFSMEICLIFLSLQNIKNLFWILAFFTAFIWWYVVNRMPNKKLDFCWSFSLFFSPERQFYLADC